MLSLCFTGHFSGVTASRAWSPKAVIKPLEIVGTIFPDRCLSWWGTGIRGLKGGFVTLPQGNQEVLLDRDKTPSELRVQQVNGMWSLSPFQCFDTVGWHMACKKLGVGGDNLTGVLHVLQLPFSAPPPSPLAPIKSRIETCWQKMAPAKPGPP